MKLVLLAVSLGLNLSVSSILLTPYFPKVDEEFTGEGSQDTTVLDVGVTATYSGQTELTSPPCSAAVCWSYEGRGDQCRGKGLTVIE